jgi:hypothetical protein
LSFRVGILVAEEMAVHVFALQVASVVASHYAVRINDGQDPGLKLFSELVGEHRL